ncbi:cytochrome c [Termitidicoccus mucosus]|uniref:Cytochrome c domain-containing protein n=1 Tax=Termitidicoccus mucosus TaxID=1184151 RepID=A0A178IJJ8_9BACT|nr:hypothetical protein AW736_09720 [Opitutaceae bacterium TSB47]
MPFLTRLTLGLLVIPVALFAWVPAVVLQRHLYPPAPAVAANEAPLPADPLLRGKRIFAQTCAACHQPDGRGMPGVFPPLAGSDYLLSDPVRAVRIVLRGLSGPVTVNGAEYNSAMPPLPLSDADAADVLTWVLQAWDNNGPAVSVETVARIRAEEPSP